MKRAIMLLALPFVIMAIGCGGGTAVKNDKTGPSDIAVAEGWITPEKFRVRAEGSPAPGIADEEQKKKSARDTALENAQKLIIKNFVSTRVHSASTKLDIVNTGMIMTKIFGGTVRGGKVTKFDCDQTGKCTMYYEVEAKNLRKRVETAGAQ